MLSGKPAALGQTVAEPLRLLDSPPALFCLLELTPELGHSENR